MVHPSKNTLAAEQFIREALNYCEGKPTFMVDSAPWLRQALEELGLTYKLNPFSDRSLIESVYSLFKRRTKIFFNNIILNPIDRSERFMRLMAC